MEQPQSSATQHITPADQLVHSSKFQEIRKCNNMVVLPNIPCLRECRIVGQLLVDHALRTYFYHFPPLSDDRERDEIQEATLLSLALHKTTKIAKEQENMAVVKEKTLKGDVEKFVEGEDEEFYASEFANKVLLDKEDFGNRIEPGSHKESPEEVDDDDDETKYDKKDDDDDDDDDDDGDHALVKTRVSGSSEISTQKMQTATSSPPRSHRRDLSSNKAIAQVFTVSVTLTPATTSQDCLKHTSSRCKILPGSIAKMNIRRGQLKKHMNNTFVTHRYFQEKMKEMNETLRNKVPRLTVSKTNELIKEALPRMVNDAIKKDRESSQAAIPTLISQEFVVHALNIIEELFKIHMKNTVINVHLMTSASTATTTASASSYMNDAFHKRDHDEHQGVDAPPEREKGPFKMGKFRETVAEGALHLGPERDRVFVDLTPEEKKRFKVYIRATNILLQGLPKDIYTLIKHYTYAKDNERETIHEYYVWFTKYINDMRNIKMTMPKMQLNLKFVNNMLPKWGRFVTAVKLNRGLKTSNYDQLYAYLKQHEAHANENKMMLKRYNQHAIDPLTFVSNVSPQQYPTQSSAIPQFAYVPPVTHEP
ncbi:hypothetical protein Tco_1484440 [Tanacetum coccineum]